MTDVKYSTISTTGHTHCRPTTSKMLVPIYWPQVHFMDVVKCVGMITKIVSSHNM